jgi:S1-C subfamily serine protease
MKKLISLMSVATATGLIFSSSSALAFKTDPPPEKTWLLQDEKNTIDIFNKMADYVVYVETRKQLREDFFSEETHEVPVGAGSGFVWNRDGYIVTNFHVIAASEGQGGIFVRLRDGRSSEAKYIGGDQRKDIAVLKLNDTKNLPEGFSTLLADTTQLQVGQKAIAIGNPFELNHTLTTGVISALNRSVPSPVGGGLNNRDMIQTDAAINPGNSGGPLMDSRGNLIGMNSVIYSQSGSSAGVGFAVPANTIKRIVSQLIKTGKVTYARLGIIDIPERYNQYLTKTPGVIIGQVVPNTGARKAGLRGTVLKRNGRAEVGDVITAIDGKKVEQLDDILAILDEKNVGDVVKVDFVRNGKKESTKVTLSNNRDD